MTAASQKWSLTDEGRGFPLLLLHGLGACAFSWRHNIAPLAQHFRVLAPDLPGHGLTPAHLVPAYRLENLVHALWQLLGQVGVRRFVAVGNSLGGSLALLMARKQPERVAALILLAPAVFLSRPPWLCYLLRPPVLGWLVAALMGPWMLPMALRLAYHHHRLITPAVIQGYAPTFRTLAHRQALRRLAKELHPWPAAQVEALLAAIHQPVCLLWGCEDRILPVSQAHGLAARLPQAELHLLPGVGHAPQEEAPEAVNKIIIAFLGCSLKN